MFVSRLCRGKDSYGEVLDGGRNPSPSSLARMRFMSVIASDAVRVYQLLLRPILLPACRFEPSCSEYYRQALVTVGFWPATWLAIRRIARCHPWHPGGYDPPPAARPRPPDESVV